MPLTAYQAELARLLAKNRSEDSYLAGGAAFLSDPNTQRYSQDLDYFHDNMARVTTAFNMDRDTLIENKFMIETEIVQPSYIRVLVRRETHATKIEWAQDSSWRFMPVLRSEEFGYQLHPIDLATNKVLALGGRDEPRDLVDTLYFHKNLLELGPLIWAAVGKDPGFSPSSLLELIRRKGKIRPEEINRLNLAQPIDVKKLKEEWLSALDKAEMFISSRLADEIGCLYFEPETRKFVNPENPKVTESVAHYGRLGGVLPTVIE